MVNCILEAPPSSPENCRLRCNNRPPPTDHQRELAVRDAVGVVDVVRQPDEEVQARLPRRAERGQDVAHNALHVRLLRQYLPGYDWHRLPQQDNVLGRPDGASAALGHGRTGEVQESHPQLHTRLVRGCGRVRCHQQGLLHEHLQMGG